MNRPANTINFNMFAKPYHKNDRGSGLSLSGESTV